MEQYIKEQTTALFSERLDRLQRVRSAETRDGNAAKGVMHVYLQESHLLKMCAGQLLGRPEENEEVPHGQSAGPVGRSQSAESSDEMEIELHADGPAPARPRPTEQELQKKLSEHVATVGASDWDDGDIKNLADMHGVEPADIVQALAAMVLFQFKVIAEKAGRSSVQLASDDPHVSGWFKEAVDRALKCRNDVRKAYFADLAEAQWRNERQANH